MTISKNWSRTMLGVLIALLALSTTSNALAGKKQSRKNEAAARSYCDKQKAAGKECFVRKAGLFKSCGKGWTRGKRFGGKGKDYVTCTRSKRHLASQSNKQKAEKYCAARRAKGVECVVKPGGIKGCGKGLKRVKTYGGKGKNYLACEISERAQQSAENRALAEKYCASRPAGSCKVVAGNIAGCGKGWTKDRTFRGKGKDYLACKKSKRQEGTERNRAQAERRCKKERALGRECVVKRANPLGCGGKNWKNAAKFGGKGKDYLSCVRTAWAVDVQFVIGSKKNPEKIKQWVREQIKVAEEVFNSDPALVINPQFVFVEKRGERELDSLKFKSARKFHKYMDDHFDYVGMSRTTGYLQFLVTDHLEIGGKTWGGFAHFPHTTQPLSRKHGPAIVAPSWVEDADVKKPCDHERYALFAHEIGHVFGLLHPWDRYVLGGTCNKSFKKGEKNKGQTIQGAQINLMDYGQNDKTKCYRRAVLNDCQKKRAARKRKQWMTVRGKIKYKKIRGSR